MNAIGHHGVSKTKSVASLNIVDILSTNLDSIWFTSMSVTASDRRLTNVISGTLHLHEPPVTLLPDRVGQRRRAAAGGRPASGGRYVLWWAAIHGYNHPRLNQAASRQLEKMSHVMFGGITHPAAISLCRRLVAMTPEALQCVFLADSGSVAVEVSLKMALQYWQARGERRQRILTLRHGYHGDTFGAMSVCDPDNSMHSLYQGYGAAPVRHRAAVPLRRGMARRGHRAVRRAAGAARR